MEEFAVECWRDGEEIVCEGDNGTRMRIPVWMIREHCDDSDDRRWNVVIRY